MIVYLHEGRIKGGKLHLFDRQRFDKEIDGLGDNRRVAVATVPRDKIRTLDQNAYYHGVVLQIIGDYIGETVEATKELFAWLITQRRGALPPKSTADMSIKEFSKLINEVVLFAWEWFEIYVPPANRFAFFSGHTTQEVLNEG